MQFDQLLETEELLFDPQSRLVDIPVWLRYTDALIQLEAASAHYDVADGTGRFDQVIYRLVGHDGSGSADMVAMVEPGRARLEQFDFTTCDPERPDWQLKAGRVDLDMERGTGIARHARLDFKGVPILYSPWLSFPLDDRRKSGFLYPSLGFSSDDGFDLSVPWYWNIAPNQDATLTPRLIQERGAMLGTEYRFLTRASAARSISSCCPAIARPMAAATTASSSIAPGWRRAGVLRPTCDAPATHDYFHRPGFGPGRFGHPVPALDVSVAAVVATGRCR
jgi:LPS-assembly protein